MVLITTAMRSDIARQREAFAMLQVAVGEPGNFSDARLLNILAWRF